MTASGYYRDVQRGFILFAAVGSVLVLGALVAMLREGKEAQTGAGPAKELRIYCAASQREPMTAVVEEYQKEFGVQVTISFGASQAELVTLERSGAGDIYLPADESYIEIARQKGLVEEVIPIAVMRPILAVRKGNRHGVRSVGDLIAKKDVKLGQANPDAAAIGKIVRDALMKSGQWEGLRERTTVFTGNVNELGNALKIGSVDAGLIWDVMLQQYPELEAVEVAELKDVKSNVSMAVLKTSKRPQEARKFVRYLMEKGLVHFSSRGFETVKQQS